MDITFPWPQRWSWWIIPVWIHVVVLTTLFRWQPPEWRPEPEPYRFITEADLPSCTVIEIEEIEEEPELIEIECW